MGGSCWNCEDDVCVCDVLRSVGGIVKMKFGAGLMDL